MTVMTTIRATAGSTEAGAGILADLPAPVSFSMPTPPSVNSIFRNVKGKGRVKTSVYDDFVRMGMAAIRRQCVGSVAGPVIAVFGVERMSLSADIDNRLKAMIDTIVKAGVIGDDRFITAIAVSWLPMANGLSHVTIYPVQALDLTFHPSTEGATGGWYRSAPQLEQEEPLEWQSHSPT